MLTVADMVETSHLGLSVVAGSNGLSNRVLWTHVAEIEDAADWLDGGELLLTTGVGIPQSAVEQVAYLRRLADVGAAAIAIGTRSQGLKQSFLDEADRLEFPILTIAVEVPFVTVARFVSAANGDTAQSRIATQVRIYDSLHARVEEDQPIGELFERLSGISGYDLYVVNRQGNSLLPGLPDVPAELTPRLLDAGDRQPSIEGGFRVTVPLAGRTAAYLVAFEAAGKEGVGLGSIRHIATIAALELSNLYRDRTDSLQRGAEALADLLAGKLGQVEISRVVKLTGFREGEPLVLGAAKSLKQRRPDREELYHRLLDLEVPALVLGRPELLYLLVQEADVELLANALGGLGLHCGLSKPLTDLQETGIARMEAMWSVQWPSSTPTDGLLTRFDESSGWLTWLPHDTETLRHIVDHTLEPIRTYDEENSTDLIHTLRVFIRNERNIGRTAEELFVHKHTLQYRLRRIREISGRSMANTRDLAELWFTFQAEALIDTTDFA